MSLPILPDEDQANAAERNAIAIIDYADHSRGGHYGPYLIWFVREFAARFDKVLVFTPDPEGSSRLLEMPCGSVANPVSFHRLPPGPRKNFFRLKRHPCLLSQVFKEARRLAPGFQWQGFVMWGFDLLQNKAIAKDSAGAPWATLGSLSHLKRNCAGSWIAKEAALEQLCEKAPDCVSLLLWDQYLVGPKVPKAQWLPGYEAIDVTPSSPLAQAIRAHAGDQFCLGAFGTLSGPRCLNELLPLTLSHPEIRFVIAGTLAEKRLRKELRPLLTTRKPENLLVLPGYFTDEDLATGIQATDGILIDGRAYPLHSGIVTKALYLGKCLFTPESDSWMSDMIRQHGVGFSYPDHRFDFAQAWREWCQAGGRERAQRIMRGLVNPTAISQCFDELTRRLVSTHRRRPPTLP